MVLVLVLVLIILLNKCFLLALFVPEQYICAQRHHSSLCYL